MNEKKEFVESIKRRTKQLSIDVIELCDNLNKSKASSVITYQLIKSSTSVGANYRAACRARSRKEFYSKICIVVEEADETEHWLELIQESGLNKDKEKMQNLIKEAGEICKILTKTKDTLYRGNNA